MPFDLVSDKETSKLIHNSPFSRSSGLSKNELLTFLTAFIKAVLVSSLDFHTAAEAAAISSMASSHVVLFCFWQRYQTENQQKMPKFEIMVKIETNQNLFVNLCPTLGQKLTFYPKLRKLPRIWCLTNVYFVKNETLKMWIMWKVKFWKCEFCKKWYFRKVNCVKIGIFNIWIFEWNMDFYPNSIFLGHLHGRRR